MHISHHLFVFLFLFGLISNICLISALGFESANNDLRGDNNLKIKQSNICMDMANCHNKLLNHDFSISKIESLQNSNQTIIQLNECNQDQICVNNANIVNDVFGSGISNGDSQLSQDIYQYCGPDDGPTCLNTNNMFVDASNLYD